MRILLIIKNFDFGGAENHVRELANSLTDTGEDVHVIGAKGRQVSQLNKNVHSVLMRMRSALLPVHFIFLIIYVIKHKIQIIHAHQRFPVFLSCLAGKITGIPVIATVHGRTRLDLRTSISRKYPSSIIFVSRHVLEVSAKYDEIKSKSVIIPNWVALPRKESSKIPYSITYVSRIDRKHSALIMMIIKEILYDLASKYAEMTFRIIGEGDYLDHVKREAELLNRKLNREVCIVCGFILDVNRKLGESELIIGVGRVAMEGMASGVPVLSMNQQRMGSVITLENFTDYKQKNFVSTGSNAPDKAGLMNLLIDFFSNIESHKKEALELMELVIREYNASEITKEIIEIYRSAINQ